MTNRFAKAVELLAHEDTSVRLGALYALERIANDSEKDYDTIIETIAAYVRSNAPRLPKEKKKWGQLEYAKDEPTKYLQGTKLPDYLLETAPDRYKDKYKELMGEEWPEC